MNPLKARQILGYSKIIGGTCNTFEDVVTRFRQTGRLHRSGTVHVHLDEKAPQPGPRSRRLPEDHGGLPERGYLSPRPRHRGHPGGRHSTDTKHGNNRYRPLFLA